MVVLDTRNLIDTPGVRKMCGRALRVDRKPITRHTLIRWRAGGAGAANSVTGAFPEPVATPHVAGIELWDRLAVKQWIAAQTFRIEEGPGAPRRDV